MSHNKGYNMYTFLINRILKNPAIPCSPLLISYILATLPFTLNFLFGFSLLTIILWIPVLLFWIFKILPRNHLSLIFMCGALNAFLYCSTTSHHISELTNLKKAYISLQGTVTNVHYPNEILQWNVKTPQYIIKSEKIFTKNEILKQKKSNRLSSTRFGMFLSFVFTLLTKDFFDMLINCIVLLCFCLFLAVREPSLFPFWLGVSSLFPVLSNTISNSISDILSNALSKPLSNTLSNTLLNAL